MSTNFPTTLDTYTNPSGISAVGVDVGGRTHSEFHSDNNDAIEALQTKVGIDGSAVTTSHDYKLSGVTGSDKAVSKTGSEVLTNKTIDGNNNTLTVLSSQISGNVPLSKGGTGASLSDPNADRILFWDDSAGQTAFLTAGSNLTITGTTISVSGIAAYSGASLAITTSTSSNPTQWDAENFDDGGFHDNGTNPERITIPADGKYLVTATIAGYSGGGNEPAFIYVLKNGTTKLLQSGAMWSQPGGWNDGGFSVSGLFQFSTGDYIEVYHDQRSNGPWSVPVAGTNFSILKVG